MYADLHDICLYHPDNGINIVPYKRWRAASLGEEGAWRHSGNATEDRVAEHMEAYGGYQALVGRPIGKMIEVGCGPFTQSKYLFERMQQIDAGNKATHLTLVDPNIPSYVQNHNCQYRTGLLMPFRVPIQFISEGGETLRLRFQEEFDTVLMTNVLEHAYNAYDLLEGLYRILKPNGTLIFHERYHDNRLNDKEKYFTLENNQKLQPYDIGKLLHPLRAKKKVIDHLLSYFDIVYQNTNTTLMRWRKEEGIYAIAVKKVCASGCLLFPYPFLSWHFPHFFFHVFAAGFEYASGVASGNIGCI